MTFPTIGATSPGTPTGSIDGGGSVPALPTDQMGRDTFLKLMVAQLRNQDPMNPTDSTQFLAQTAQFTSLEKLEAVADQSAQSLAAQMAFGASSMVGRTVAYTAADGSQVTGLVGSVRFTADGPLLGVGDAEVPLNDVVTVSDSPSTTSA